MTARESAATFEVVGVLPHGGVRVARVLAPDSQRAAEQLQLEGLRVLSCRPAARNATDWLSDVLPRRARLDVGLFTEELAALLEAGLGMVDAIRKLSVKEQDARARAALERVAVDLTEGQPLSRTLSNQPYPFAIGSIVTGTPAPPCVMVTVADEKLAWGYENDQRGYVT